MRRVLEVLAFLALSAALALLPGPRTVVNDGARTIRAEVAQVDDSDLQLHGFVEFGTQHLKVRLPDGSVRAAANELRAQLELDKKFAPGDTATVILPADDDGKATLIARDHWRTGYLAALFGGFSLLLVVFGGWVGAKALFSFVFGCLAVWKLLIPLCLDGWNASLTCFLIVSLLTALIMGLVAGLTRKALVATLGALLGVLASLGLSDFFAAVLHVNGATMPFAQQLIFSGYDTLDLADVFTGAVILGSSGAVMDLAMDIASASAEVVRHRPDIPRRELLRSALRVGRSVVGTMTTTLLFAYAGGYLTLLMVFAAQGTHPLDILNSTLVSAEVVRTLVGSFGLVLVAPFTALMAAALLRGKS